MKITEEDLREIADRVGNGLGHYFSDGKFDWCVTDVDDQDDPITYTITITKVKD